MAAASIYQKFLRAAWQRFKRDYPFVARFEEAFCVAMPKSSSFLIGQSPLCGKYFVLEFQHNSKKPGQFTINVHISTELAPTSAWPAFEGFDDAQDGYYRLAAQVLGRDQWWCLNDRDRSFDAFMAQKFAWFDADEADQSFYQSHWRPSSWLDADTVIQEALEDTFALIDRSIMVKFGFTAPS